MRRARGWSSKGPNCLGFVNFIDNVSLTFIEMPEPKATGDRRVGGVSQSGAMAAVLATTMIDRMVPLSCYVSTGNEAASGIEDYLDHLAGEDGTAVIALIAEHIRRPDAFLSGVRTARAAGKAIVMLHPGQSKAGAESAATHTGAMVGNYAVMRTHVERAGVIMVDTLEELGDVTEILARCESFAPGGTGIVAESGAFKAMMLDLAERVGMNLPKISDDDSPILRAALPDFVPVTNPFDVTTQGLVDPTLYSRTMHALAADDRIGTILLTLIQTAPHTSTVKFNAVLEAIGTMSCDKPVIVGAVDEGGGVKDADVAALRDAGVTFLPTAERARDYSAVSLCDTAIEGLAQEGAMIPEYRSKEIMRARGIPFPAFEMVHDGEAAVAAAERLGYPVVLKAQSSDLPHKSDAGGVIVGLSDADSVRKGYADLVGSVGAARPDLSLDGVLVEAMAAKGVELIVGARHDPHLGATILVGFGGVAAELLHDVCLMPADLTKEAIIREILGLRMAALLTGFRGAPKMDVEAVAEVAQALSRLVASNPDIREIELNSVIVYPEGQGALALDALISL